MLDLKKDFPIFDTYPELVYLDSAATSQKPQVVLDAITEYYKTANANVHRGVHFLSDKSTTVFENAKKDIADFFGARENELILTRNATESLNGVAYGWAKQNVGREDIILVSVMEHHANLVPWQEVAKHTGAKLEFIDLTEDGELDFAHLEKLLNNYGQKVKMVAVAHVSNALGTITSTGEIKKLINKYSPKARLVVDGAQSAPHMKINFSNLGADFYAFSGHKMLGPMGIGGLLVKEELLKSEEMRPWLFGGGMIEAVFKNETRFHENLSERFIAGTPDVASTVGLAAACKYLHKIGMEKVEQADHELISYALERLREVEDITIIGPKNPKNRLGSVSFIHKTVHAHDVAQVLDSQHIAVRSGHHCTMPLHQEQNWIATVRASFGVYSDKEDIDKLISAFDKIKSIFG